MTAKQHYDSHLGSVYSWMLGDFHEKMSEQMDFFIRQGIEPGGTRIAFDLGAGNGIQSVALARLGFKVTAVDFNQQLLKDLRENKRDFDIRIINEDIIDFLTETQLTADIIACMGDTLTHLRSEDEVRLMTTKVGERLSPGGKVILSYRDLSEERKEKDRFFHIRSDDSRSMVCFLEYFPGHVMVHDILIEKERDRWVQSVSSYPKLRIANAWLKKIMKQNGLTVIHQETIRGMFFMIGIKR